MMDEQVWLRLTSSCPYSSNFGAAVFPQSWFKVGVGTVFEEKTKM